jgi:hypothetical protein
MFLEREFSRPLMRRRFPNGKWTCAFEHDDWHVQAERLELEILATSSPSLRALLERDRALLLEQARASITAEAPAREEAAA